MLKKNDFHSDAEILSILAIKFYGAVLVVKQGVFLGNILKRSRVTACPNYLLNTSL